jgi:hypothetical protein
MLRMIRILKLQLQSRSLSDSILMLAKSLFKNERIWIYAKELNNGIDEVLDEKAKYEVVKGNVGEINDAKKNLDKPYWEFSCNLYDGVTDCFVCKYDNAIAHISWIYYKQNPNRILDLQVGEAEIKYSFTLPQFRGKGIYPVTLISIQRYLKKNGFTRIFICTKEDNYSSVKGIEKAGFTFIRKINLIKLLGVQLTRRYATER